MYVKHVLLLRYADSVGTNYEQRGMGCVQPADRYFLKITSFTQVLSFVSQAYYYPLYRRLIIILCISGLQREPSGFQAADHGGDGSHQGREEAEGPGSSVFLGKEEIEAKFHPSG